jgi:hypothetical protein
MGTRSQLRDCPMHRNYHPFQCCGSGSGTLWEADPDLHPHQSGKLDQDSDPHQNVKQDPNPNPHQSEKVEAFEGHFGALEGPNLGRSEW